MGLDLQSLANLTVRIKWHLKTAKSEPSPEPSMQSAAYDHTPKQDKPNAISFGRIFTRPNEIASKLKITPKMRQPPFNPDTLDKSSKASE